MKIKAAVLYEDGLPRPYADTKPLKIHEVDLQEPGEGEVLVKVMSAGLCHSDLSVMEGNRPRPMPMIPGHEGAGIVEKVGDKVDRVKPGDHVVFIFAAGCGRCRQCHDGKSNICETFNAARAAGDLMTGGKRLSIDGQEIGHYAGISCFAEYATVVEASVCKIPDDIPFQDAAIFSCAVLTGTGAALNTAGVRPGQSVAVIGLGGVGLSCMLGAQVAGASQIIAIDEKEDKLGVARQLGATDTVWTGDPDCVEKVKALTNGGVDFAFEMAGRVGAMQLAYDVTARGGTTVSSGLSPFSQNFTIQHCALVGDEKTVKGSYMGSCIPERDLPRFISLYRDQKLPIDRLRSATLPLDKINEGYDLLSDADTIRQIVMFD